MVIIGILKVYLNKLTTLYLATGRGGREEEKMEVWIRKRNQSIVILVRL
jgi:hypothetical protein